MCRWAAELRDGCGWRIADTSRSLDAASAEDEAGPHVHHREGKRPVAAHLERRWPARQPATAHTDGGGRGGDGAFLVRVLEDAQHVEACLVDELEEALMVFLGHFEEMASNFLV